MLRKSDFYDKFKGFLGIEATDIPLEDVTLDMIVIRELRYSDVSKIIAIQKKVYEGVTPWSKTIFINELNGNKPVQYLCAQYQGEIIGFSGIRIEETNAHISNLALLTDFQNKGIGKKLINKMLLFSETHRCTSVTLEVRTSNIKAKRLYENFGFFVSGVKKNYYNDGTDALLMMRKQRAVTVDVG